MLNVFIGNFGNFIESNYVNQRIIRIKSKKVLIQLKKFSIYEAL